MNDDLVRLRDVPPPKRGGRRVDWAAITREARAHPDEWVMVPETMHVSVAANIRRGQYTSIKPDEFVVTTRKAHDDPKPNRVHMYVRVRS